MNPTAVRPRIGDLTLLVIVAFAPRLLVGLSIMHAGLFADMSEYHVRAHHILREGTVRDAWRGPGYPALLGLLAWTIQAPELIERLATLARADG